jgi:hypothetical protein
MAAGANSWTIDGILLREGLNQITVTALDAAGNVGAGTLAVTYNPEYLISTVAGGNTRVGELGDGRPAASVALAAVKLIALDRVRKVDQSGVITTHPVGQAGFDTHSYYPVSRLGALAVGPDGNLYFASGGRVQKAMPSGVVTAIAGNGVSCGETLGDGGPAVTANLCNPTSIAFDRQGNIYIAEAGRYRIRKVDRSGIITTVAGSGAGQRGNRNARERRRRSDDRGAQSSSLCGVRRWREPAYC